MKSQTAVHEIESKLNDGVFRALMENANDAIFVLNEDGGVIHANRQAGKLLGLTIEELKGKAYHEFVLPDDMDHALSQVGQIIGGTPNSHSEVRLRRSDGAMIFVDFSAVMVELESGRAMMSIGRDITEQKKLEVDRARLGAIVESSNDAIYAMDMEGVINVWNPGAERLFGYGANEVLGHPIFMLVPSDRHVEAIKMIEACGQGRAFSHFETTRKNRLQERIPISVNWFPIRDKKGAILGISAIVRDLSEQKKSEPFRLHEDE